MRYVEKDGKRYVDRQGKLIEIMTIEPKRKTQPPQLFKSTFCKFPSTWRNALRKAHSAGTTYELALVILFEAFKRQHRRDGEVVLSAEKTGMSRTSRRRAMRELAKLGLIKLHRQSGNQAYRVILLST